MSKFKNRVIEIVNSLPKGTVVSYGQVALMAGVPRAAQAVRQILHNEGENAPWWRVVNNAGRISTKCTEHPANMQKKLLEKEGLVIKKNLTFDIERYRYVPDPKTLKRFELDDKYIQVILEKYF